MDRIDSSESLRDYGPKRDVKVLVDTSGSDVSYNMDALIEYNMESLLKPDPFSTIKKCPSKTIKRRERRLVEDQDCSIDGFLLFDEWRNNDRSGIEDWHKYDYMLVDDSNDAVDHVAYLLGNHPITVAETLWKKTSPTRIKNESVWLKRRRAAEFSDGNVWTDKDGCNAIDDNGFIVPDLVRPNKLTGQVKGEAASKSEDNLEKEWVSF